MVVISKPQRTIGPCCHPTDDSMEATKGGETFDDEDDARAVFVDIDDLTAGAASAAGVAGAANTNTATSSFDHFYYPSVSVVIASNLHDSYSSKSTGDSSRKKAVATTPTTAGANTSSFSALSSSSTWNITDFESLPKVGSFHIMEKTQTTIRVARGEGGDMSSSSFSSDTTVSKVVERICDCLKAMSMHSIFDDEKAEAFVRTSDFVEFYVRLYQAGSESMDATATSIAVRDDGEYSLSSFFTDTVGFVVAEVQRKRGCPIAFHRIARVVLESASASLPSHIQCREWGRHITFKRHSVASISLSSGSHFGGAEKVDDSEMEERTDASFERAIAAAAAAAAIDSTAAAAIDSTAVVVVAEGEKAIVDDALDRAFDLMKRTDRYDANELGIESLVFLTDADCSGVAMASYAAERILLRGGGGEDHGNDDDDDDDYHHNAGDDDGRWERLLLAIFDGGDQNDGIYSKGIATCAAKTECEFQHMKVMRLLALTALANALSLLASGGDGCEQHLCSGSTGSLGIPLCASHASSNTSALRMWINRPDFLAFLVDDMNNAEARPHNAHEATRCWNAILQLAATAAKFTGSPAAAGCLGDALRGVESMAIELGVASAAMVSQSVGHGHLKLKREADILVARLQ